MIGKTIQAAHEKDVTHCDIKSANIMITDKGQVKIMDFGLAKGADLRVCPKPDTHPDAHEGEHIGSPLPPLSNGFKQWLQTNTFAVSNSTAGHTFRANCGREMIMIA